nr:MAG TPA: hypothetical protein [Caudoviricetes sp.]
MYEFLEVCYDDISINSIYYLGKDFREIFAFSFGLW